MYLSDYIGVLLLMGLGVLIPVGAIVTANLLGAKRFYPRKTEAYECGVPTLGAENQRYSVKFYLVAVSFILFDIETVFMVPWALEFNPMLEAGDGLYVWTLGAVFLIILTLGLIYEWRKGLLDWNN